MSDELTALLAKATEYVRSMTPEQRQEMFEDQRRAMLKAARETPENETRVIVVADTREVVEAAPEPSQPDYRLILLSLIASLSLAEGSGDVSEDCWRALKLAQIVVPDDIDDDGELADWLASKYNALGVWAMKAPTDQS